MFKAIRYNIFKQWLSEPKELGVVINMFGGGIMEDEIEVLKMTPLEGVLIVS